MLYFLIGTAIRSKETWSRMFRNSALALGTLISLGALIITKENGGWYALVIGLLFAADMYFSRNGWFEIGIPILFNIGAFLILSDLNVDKFAYHLLAYSLVWLLTRPDSASHLRKPAPAEVDRARNRRGVDARKLCGPCSSMRMRASRQSDSGFTHCSS